MKFIVEELVTAHRTERNITDNVATHWFVQCSPAARGKAVGLQLSRKLTDGRRL